MSFKRTPPHKKARQLAQQLRAEHPDYNYLRKLFQHLRQELEIEVPTHSQKLPYVPTEAELKKLYQAIWETKRFQDLIITKTFLYTGVRVSELVNIRLEELDLEECRIRVHQGKGGKGRIVLFPPTFKETLAMHHATMKQKKATYLFESSWKRKYSERGIHRMLQRYTQAAGVAHNISPHQLRHFLLLWLKKQGIDDALIQPYSGHAQRQSLEVYSRLSLQDAQATYNAAMKHFPI